MSDKLPIPGDYGMPDHERARAPIQRPMVILERWTIVIQHHRSDLTTEDIRQALDAIRGVKTVAIHFEEVRP